MKNAKTGNRQPHSAEAPRGRQATGRSAVLRVGLLLAAVTLTGAACVRQPAGPGPKLVVWGPLDDTETLRPLLDAFAASQRRSGRVEIEYKKVSPLDQYEERLRTALAEGRGPDVFLVHASWIPRWLGTMLPAPDEVVTARQVREEFVQTVAEDAIVNNRIAGLPLFVDSLALYVNRDLLNAAGIARPPSTWTEAQSVVRRTTRFNPREAAQIDQHGITLGAARNVNRAPDILSVLMLQNLGDAPMVQDDGTMAFGGDQRAIEALRFFTSFSNPGKDIYTWTLTSDYSLDAFAEGEAALMLNYSYHRPTLRLKNPRLNFALAPLPQVNPGSPVTYASSWAFAVSRTTPNPLPAWQLIRFLTGEEQARAYLKSSGYPPARRDLVDEFKSDPELGVFAEQSLTARTWRQPDNRVVDRVFAEAIDAVVSGRDTEEGALRRAAEQIDAAATALGNRLPPRGGEAPSQ